MHAGSKCRNTTICQSNRTMPPSHCKLTTRSYKQICWRCSRLYRSSFYGGFMPRIQCFMLEPTGKVSVKLRRYSRSDSGNSCPLDPSKYSYHNASTLIGQEPEEYNERGYTS